MYDKKDNFYELLNSFINIIYNICKRGHIIDNNFFEVLKYHRLDLLFYDISNNYSLPYQSILQLNNFKNKIENTNNNYLEEMKILTKLFNKNGIKFVFLKGSSLILNSYKQIYHRYFHDIDILISEKEISKVVGILNKLGYVYGDFENEMIYPATREEVLYQRMHTHEIYNMVRVNKNNICLNLDVNFKFMWKGFNNENLALEDILNYITFVEFENLKMPILNIEYQFLHLCTHFYNEAVYFLLDNDYDEGEDAGEILLIRLFDVLLLINKDINLEQLYLSAKNNNFLVQIEFVLSLLYYITGEKYISKFYSYFKIDINTLNYFFTRQNKKVEWPINIDERLFNIKKKEKCIKILHENKIL